MKLFDLLARALGVLAISVFAISSTGCNTTEGVGEDIQEAGEELEEAAEDLAD